MKVLQAIFSVILIITRGAGIVGGIASPIFLEIGKIFAFSTLNTSRSK